MIIKQLNATAIVISFTTAGEEVQYQISEGEVQKSDLSASELTALEDAELNIFHYAWVEQAAAKSDKLVSNKLALQNLAIIIDSNLA